jgi:DDE family transposase
VQIAGLIRPLSATHSGSARFEALRRAEYELEDVSIMREPPAPSEPTDAAQVEWAMIDRYLRRRGIGAVIARKDNERRSGSFDKEAYRQRNLVERLINRLKQFRRVATRHEKRAENYRAMLTIAAIVIWACL